MEAAPTTRQGRSYRAEDRRKRNVGCIAAGAEAHEAHRDCGAGGIEDVPPVTEAGLDKPPKSALIGREPAALSTT
jgi:hypothetical protein